MVGIVGIVIAVLLAAALALVILPRSQAHANVLDTTCAQAPSVEHCHHHDPETEGCVADVQTKASVGINDANGNQVGILQLRFSQACNSWWGRIFDERHLPGKPQALFLQIAGDPLISAPSYVDANKHILYSFMIYNPVLLRSSPLPPQIDGSLPQDGVDAPHATIPGFAPAGTA